MVQSQNNNRVSKGSSVLAAVLILALLQTMRIVQVDNNVSSGLALGMNKTQQVISHGDPNTHLEKRNNESIIERQKRRLCVAVSIFGTREKVRGYQRPSLRMINSMIKYLPQWEFHLYYDSTMQPDESYFEDVRKINLTSHFFARGKSIGREGCFWRFESHDICDVVFFRDIELPFTEIDSPYITGNFLDAPQSLAYFQVVHPRNNCQFGIDGGIGQCRRKVLGGLYMMKHIPTLNMTDAIHRYKEKDIYGADEFFLSEEIHPKYDSVVYYDPAERIKKTVRLDQYNRTENYVEMQVSFKDESRRRK